jgi:hypothetical protein
MEARVTAVENDTVEFVCAARAEWFGPEPGCYA